MTTTLDNECRAVLSAFLPGDVLEIEPQGADAILLRRLKTSADPKPHLERRDGRLVFVGGAKITNDDVRRMIEDEE